MSSFPASTSNDNTFDRARIISALAANAADANRLTSSQYLINQLRGQQHHQQQQQHHCGQWNCIPMIHDVNNNRIINAIQPHNSIHSFNYQHHQLGNYPTMNIQQTQNAYEASASYASVPIFHCPFPNQLSQAESVELTRDCEKETSNLKTYDKENSHEGGCENENSRMAACGNEVHGVGCKHKRKGGVMSKLMKFPYLLYKMLMDAEKKNYAHVMNWLPHGRGMIIYNIDEFLKVVMPIYFSNSKWKSFLR